MDTQVIELNQKDAVLQPAKNGDYRITLATPITINDGDQIVMRMASLDTQRTAPDTIVLDEDVGLAMSFSYYDINYVTTDKVQFDEATAWTDLDFDYYAMYRGGTRKELTSFQLQGVGFTKGFVNDPGTDPIYIYQGTFVVNKGDNPVPDAETVCTIVMSYVGWDGKPATFTCTGHNLWRGNSSPGSGNEERLMAENIPNIQIDGIPANLEYLDGTLKLLSVRGKYPAAGIYGSNVQPDPNKDLLYLYSGSAYPGNGGNDLPAPFSPGVPGFKGANIKTSDFVLDKASIVSVDKGAGPSQLDIQTATGNLSQGTYTPQSMAIQLTQLFNDSQGLNPNLTAADNQTFAPENRLLILTDEPGLGEVSFRKVDFTDPENTVVTFTNSNTYKYKGPPGGAAVAIPYYVGAEIFDMEFGNDGANVFSLNYAHTPLHNPGDPASKQSVGVYTEGDIGTNNLRYYQINQASGIIIHDLQPPSFWRDTIGLSNQLIVPIETDASGVNFYTRQNVGPTLTYGYAPLSTFLGGAGVAADYYRKAKVPLAASNVWTYFDVTGDTRAIFGNTTNSNTTGGYFLIEVVGLAPRTSGMVDGQQVNPMINGIVSTQYDSNNIVTGFGDSGIQYQHRGASYQISSCQVRILNPLTLQPVEELGPNNTIFFDVIKPQVVAQPTKTTK